MDRAYSLLHVKSFDASGRSFSGIATTPEPDRIGDIIEPLGIHFKNPLSLLLFHDTHQPVGTVKFGRPTRDGVPFDAVIPEVTEAGEVKNLTDKAAHFVKYGLIRAVSIGFNSLDNAVERLKNGGLRFLKTEVLELSLVPIPANAEALITTVKSLDAEYLAASGTGTAAPARPPAGVSAPTRTASSRGRPAMKKTIADQIKDFESTRAANAARMTELMDAAAEKGETLDDAQAQEHDDLAGKVKSIDAHLVRLREQDASNVAAAKAVVATDPASGSQARVPQSVVTVKSTLPPGIEFARMVMCVGKSFLSGGAVNSLEYAKGLYPDNARILQYLKGAVPAATTTDAVWAGPLIDQTNLVSEFLEYLRPSTIIGKFGTGGIPSLRRVPFNIRITGQTGGGTGYWVGQGAPKPLTSFAFNAQTLLWAKVAAIAVLTEETIRFSTPSAESLVRDALRDAIVERLDVDFIDPTQVAVANVSPASITNGLVALSPSGTSADAARADVARLLKTFLDANQNVAGLVLIMPNALALSLSMQRNSLGQKEFPDLTMNGGSLEGIPVITSQYAANQSGGGNLVIAVNTRFVLLADDGQVTIDASREASLQMLDNPTNNSATATPTTMVSMFQTNSIALRAERFINWAVARTGAVVYMDDVNWGSIGSPA